MQLSINLTEKRILLIRSYFSLLKHEQCTSVYMQAHWRANNDNNFQGQIDLATVCKHFFSTSSWLNITNYAGVLNTVNTIVLWQGSYFAS